QLLQMLSQRFVFRLKLLQLRGGRFGACLILDGRKGLAQLGHDRELLFHHVLRGVLALARRRKESEAQLDGSSLHGSSIPRGKQVLIEISRGAKLGGRGFSPLACWRVP